MTNRRNFLKFLSIGATKVAIPNTLFARDDLSILTLFRELLENNLTKPEKGYEKPIYVGENFPTIIIIGDIHVDEYNVTRKCLRELSKSKSQFIIEEDEGHKKEVNAVRLLGEKYGINFIGLEGEHGETYNDTFNPETLIARNLYENTNYFLLGLSKQDLEYEHFYLTILSYIYQRNMFLSEISKNELDKVRQRVWNEEVSYSLDEVIKILYGGCISLVDSSNINFIEELTFVNYEYFEYFFKETFNFKKEHFEDFLWFEGFVSDKFKVELNYSQKDIKEFLNRKDEEIIKERDFFAAEKMSEEMRKYKTKVGVIVFGKAHIKGLTREFKRIYNNRINIYVAK